MNKKLDKNQIKKLFKNKSQAQGGSHTGFMGGVSANKSASPRNFQGGANKALSSHQRKG